MSTTKTPCRSKNPAACPYHGKGYSFKRLEEEADQATKAGKYEEYSYIRNAMDEIIRDKAFELNTIDTSKVTEATKALVTEPATEKPSAIERLKAHEEKIKAERAAKNEAALAKAKAQSEYVKNVKENDQKYAAVDKVAAKKLSLRLSAVGGVAFKFYSPASPATLEPDKYETADVKTSELRAGDVIGSGGVVQSVTRGAKTPTGKSDVVYVKPDGSYVRGTWWNATDIRISRPKNEELVTS